LAAAILRPDVGRGAEVLHDAFIDPALNCRGIDRRAVLRSDGAEKLEPHLGPTRFHRACGVHEFDHALVA
jgi:hypothetical protein